MKDLLIDDEKICEVICGKKKCENTDCSCFNEAQRVLKAELAHLAKLGIVYVKKECPYILSNCQGGGRCPDEFKWDGCVRHIPLSDYMKQMEAKE